MLPHLLHPIRVEIRKKDLEYTAIMDDDLNEPIGQVRRERAPIVLRAQIKIESDKDAVPTEGPIEESERGYVLFLTRELHAAQVTIERGDRIVKIGEGTFARDVNLYITKLQWRGHYPWAGGPTLLKAHFQDRHPSRLADDGAA
jgi:hypothetical protein